MTNRFRNWSFTDFSLSKDYVKCLNPTYLIYGEEICPTSNNKHHQGYFELSTAMSLTAIKKKLKNTEIHLEVSKGNSEQNITYCKKDGNFIEHGKPKQQGKRTDIETVRTMIKEGKQNYEILEEVSSFQAVKCIETIRQMSIKPRTEKPFVEWYYGDTGTGKTKTAIETFKNEYDSIDYSNNFVIGYYGHENVLFDEFRGQTPLHILLKMLDRYKCIINVKGGSCNFSPKHIIITSNKHPKDVYKLCDENINQLLRRIDSVRYFKSENYTEVNYTEVAGNTKPRLNFCVI